MNANTSSPESQSLTTSFPGSLFSALKKAGKRDPGNEVVSLTTMKWVLFQDVVGQALIPVPILR